MAGNNNIPERLINFNVYDSGFTLLGIADIELPELEQMSDTIAGAGIAGEVESGTLGHYAAMSTTINFRSPTIDAAKLAAPGTHAIEVRGSMQIHDGATGEKKTQAVRVAMSVQNKVFSIGSFEPSATTDTSNEFEVSRIKMWIGGVPVLEIDKFNFVCVFFGIDYLASVRKDLGII